MGDIKLNKQVYDKNSYTKIINNSFNKLGESINEKIVNPTLSLNEFFDMYNDLFYDIPELGERNSHEYLIKKSDATFFVKIKGDSMIDASINDGDIVIIYRSMQAKIGDIVLASVDGNFTIKTLSKYKLKPRLLPANEKYKPIEIDDNTQFELWGVVTGAVRKFK